MKLAALLLLWCSAAGAVDLSALKVIVTQAPYNTMTDSAAYTALTSPITVVEPYHAVTDRDLYDLLGPAPAEQFLATLNVLTDSTKYPGTAPIAAKCLRWLDSSVNVSGLNVGSPGMRAWLDQLAVWVPSIAGSVTKIKAAATYQSTPAAQAGFYDTFTAADITAARALP